MSTANEWRCFHCDEVFYDSESAAAHFGSSECAEVACKISDKELRQLQWELDRYRDEDGPKDRELAVMRSKHAQELLRAEEAGYDKGLQDGKNLQLQQ